MSTTSSSHPPRQSRTSIFPVEIWEKILSDELLDDRDIRNLTQSSTDMRDYAIGILLMKSPSMDMLHHGNKLASIMPYVKREDIRRIFPDIQQLFPKSGIMPEETADYNEMISNIYSGMARNQDLTDGDRDSLIEKINSVESTSNVLRIIQSLLVNSSKDQRKRIREHINEALFRQRCFNAHAKAYEAYLKYADPQEVREIIDLFSKNPLNEFGRADYQGLHNILLAASSACKRNDNPDACVAILNELAKNNNRPLEASKTFKELGLIPHPESRKRMMEHTVKQDYRSRFGELIESLSEGMRPEEFGLFIDLCKIPSEAKESLRPEIREKILDKLIPQADQRNLNTIKTNFESSTLPLSWKQKSAAIRRTGELQPNGRRLLSRESPAFSR